MQYEPQDYIHDFLKKKKIVLLPPENIYLGAQHYKHIWARGL